MEYTQYGIESKKTEISIIEKYKPLLQDSDYEIVSADDYGYMYIKHIDDIDDYVHQYNAFSILASDLMRDDKKVVVRLHKPNRENIKFKMPNITSALEWIANNGLTGNNIPEGKKKKKKKSKNHDYYYDNEEE